MICIEISKPGEPEVLVPVERPTPAPGNGEVLINVAAAGVNRPDVMQRRGKYPPPPGASDIPGLEVAGTIDAIGSGVTKWKRGDRVCALLAGGGYADHCVAPAPQCLPVPSRLDVVAAAALPETYFTVWTNLFERGRLSAGEAVLIHGGSSGIGTTAIQLARAFGARVFATAGSAEKCAACERIGAERCINYKTEDFVAIVRDLTRGAGVNVVLDMPSFAKRGVDWIGRHVRDTRAKRVRHRSCLLLGCQVDRLRASSSAERGEAAELRQRGFRHEHRVIDRSAAVAVDFDDRRHLETAGRAAREGKHGGEAYHSHLHTMP